MPDSQCPCSTSKTSAEYLVANSCLLIVGLFTVAGNVLFILTVAFNAKLRQSPTNKILVSNAVVDMLVGLFVMPFHIYKSMLNGCWDLGVDYCHFSQSLDLHLSTMSIFNLTAVAAERFFRIVTPYWYERRAKCLLPFAIIVSWILPTPTTFGGVFGNVHQYGAFTRNVTFGTTSAMYNPCGKPKPRACTCSYWATSDFTIGTTFFQFFVPVVCVFGFYLAIFYVGIKQARKIENLKRSVAVNSRLSLSSVDGNPSGSPSSMRRASAPSRRGSHALFFDKNIKVVRLCALVFLAFFLCWSPYFILMTLESTCSGVFYSSDTQILFPNKEDRALNERLKGWFYAVLWLGLLNSFLNPVLLFTLEKSYRTGLKLILVRRLPRIAKFLKVVNPLKPTYLNSIVASSNDDIISQNTVGKFSRQSSLQTIF